MVRLDLAGMFSKRRQPNEYRRTVHRQQVDLNRTRFEMLTRFVRLLTFIVFLLNLFDHWDESSSSKNAGFIETYSKSISVWFHRIHPWENTLPKFFMYSVVCRRTNGIVSPGSLSRILGKGSFIFASAASRKSPYNCSETWNLVVGRVWADANCSGITGSKLKTRPRLCFSHLSDHDRLLFHFDRNSNIVQMNKFGKLTESIDVGDFAWEFCTRTDTRLSVTQIVIR